MPPDNDEVVFVTDEPSRVHRISPPPQSSGEKLWRWALLVVSTLVAAMVLVGGLGRAFYVTRAEYASDARTELVARENMRGTLERLDRTLTEQVTALHELANEVQAIKLDLAKLDLPKASRYKKR